MKTLRTRFSRLAMLLAPTLVVACGQAGDVGDVPDVPAEEAATLAGTLRDWSNAPVAGAEAVLLIGAKPVTHPVVTDENGRYEIQGVPAADLLNAISRGEEVTVTFESPFEDLAPLGTVEGDRVHLLPITVEEFIDVDDVKLGATIPVRDAFVPLQAKGFKITKELIDDGGELTWTFPDSPVGGELKVTLILEPGAIRLAGDEVQDEITLTPLDAERAPMQIPTGGYGVLWTIQPRDVVFDPPAKIRIEGERMSIIGLSGVDVGTPFEIYGASLEEGWHKFGDVQIAALEGGRVTLESTTGIIEKGAWGHVFAATGTDAGVLVTCRDAATLAPVACAVVDDNWQRDPATGMGTTTGAPVPGEPWRQVGNITLAQADYGSQHRQFYYTDVEPICAGCTNNGAPHSQLALGLHLCKHYNAPENEFCSVAKDYKYMRVKAVRLCGSVLATTDLAARDAQLVPNSWKMPSASATPEPYEALSPVFGVGDRNFSYQAVINLPACP